MTSSFNPENVEGLNRIEDVTAGATVQSAQTLLKLLVKASNRNHAFRDGLIDRISISVENSDFLYDYEQADVESLKDQVAEDDLEEAQKVILPATHSIDTEFYFDAMKIRTLGLPDDIDFSFGIKVKRDDEPIPENILKLVAKANGDDDLLLFDDYDDDYRFVRQLDCSVDTIDGDVVVCESFYWEGSDGAKGHWLCTCDDSKTHDLRPEAIKDTVYMSASLDEIGKVAHEWRLAEELISQVDDENTYSRDIAIAFRTLDLVKNAIKMYAKI